MIQHHVHNGWTDQFKQVGVRDKNNRNEINSVDDHRVWLCIRITYNLFLIDREVLNLKFC